jgi:hypothetical protein
MGTLAHTPVSNRLVKTTRIKCLVSVILVSAAVCVLLYLLPYDSDERNVLRAAVEEVHGLDGVEQYVLRAKTGPCTLAGMSSFHRKKLAVPVSANANFWIKNLVCWSLPANLSLKYRYTEASERDLQPVYTSKKPDAKTALLQSNLDRSYGSSPFLVWASISPIPARLSMLNYCTVDSVAAASTTILRNKMAHGE